MKVKLWLWYAPGTEDQIAEACLEAEKELANRDIAISAAFAATVAANELEDTATDADWSSTIDQAAVAAWFAAEFAAFDRLSHLTGEWPSQATLIVVEG